MRICQITLPGWLRRGSIIALALTLASDGALAATASPWAASSETRARLIAATTAVGTAETVSIGLQIELTPGWKTYWRSPGDAGTPPRLDWSGSENLAKAELLWPVPERFDAFGLETFGYGHEVVLPIRARLAHSGAALKLKLKLDYQVCEQICVPIDATLALMLPAGPATASGQAPILARYEAAVPGPNGAGGLTIEHASVITDGPGLALEVGVASDAPLDAPELIAETDRPVSFGRAATSFGPSRQSAIIRLPISGSSDPKVLAGSELVLTLIDGGKAIEARISPGRQS